MDENFYQVIHQDKLTNARYGKMMIQNEFGSIEIETPMFMPVGTRGTVKAISQDDLEEIGYRLILGNAYHLYLKPGTIIEKWGGLKNFMSWKGAILTDSGGFQVYSLSHIRKLEDDGVMFQSYFDGTKHKFTPQNVIDFQFILSSDIMMVLDDCPPASSDWKRINESINRTHKWAKISREYFEEKKKHLDQYHKKLFGIVQGGVNEEMRLKSLEFIESLNFDGIAVGGLSVGEKKEDFERIVEFIGPKIQKEKVHYLMGVGAIPDLLKAIENGFDIFDCVLPTRNARHGYVFTSQGKLIIKHSRYKDDLSPLDSECQCKVCKRYSRAYIRYLYQVKELLVFHLITYHNLFFFYNFFKKIREAILLNNFKKFLEYWRNFDW